VIKEKDDGRWGRDEEDYAKGKEGEPAGSSLSPSSKRGERAMEKDLSGDRRKEDNASA